jgi:hypothetical protein
MTHANTYDLGLDLWKRWTRMWNGEPALARALVAPSFVLHLPLPSDADASAITTPIAVERWIAAHRAKFTSLTFRYDAGPFVDTVAGAVVGPWIAEAVIAGAPRLVCGMDTIAFRDGKVTEYWTVGKDVTAFGAWITRS